MQHQVVNTRRVWQGMMLKFLRKKMKRRLEVQRLGLVPYQQAWDLQEDLATRIATGRQPETLLLLEHPHIFTLGRRGKAEHLLWAEDLLRTRGVTVLWVDRGGDITYHGPGQLVGYPMLRLAPIGWQQERLPQADYVGYIRRLETVLMKTLASFGIMAIRVPGKTGVWVPSENGPEPKKIASIGVKVDAQGISRHGFALNINPDMAYWSGIIPCGLDEVEMTSMAVSLSRDVTVGEVQEVLVGWFAEVFRMAIVSSHTEQ